MGALGAALERRREERESERGEADADPLPARHLVREEAIGGDGEQHESACDHRLHEGDRSERKRDDVEAPADGRDHDPERVPAVAKERERAPHRLAPLDVGRSDRAAMLVEEAEHRGKRRGDGEEQADLDGEGHWGREERSAAAIATRWASSLGGSARIHRTSRQAADGPGPSPSPWPPSSATSAGSAGSALGRLPHAVRARPPRRAVPPASRDRRAACRAPRGSRRERPTGRDRSRRAASAAPCA